MKAMDLVNAVELFAPIECGQVVLENLLGTGANLVATRGEETGS
jgi:CxxC motif-containing protein